MISWISKRGFVPLFIVSIGVMLLLQMCKDDVKPTNNFLGVWKIVDGTYAKYVPNTAQHQPQPQPWKLDYTKVLTGEVTFLAVNKSANQVDFVGTVKNDAAPVFPLIGYVHGDSILLEEKEGVSICNVVQSGGKIVNDTLSILIEYRCKNLTLHQNVFKCVKE